MLGANFTNTLFYQVITSKCDTSKTFKMHIWLLHYSRLGQQVRSKGSLEAGILNVDVMLDQLCEKVATWLVKAWESIQEQSTSRHEFVPLVDIL